MSLAAPTAPTPSLRGIRSTQPKAPREGALEMTPEEFHAFLRDAPEKYEYHDGKAVPMAGSSFEHVIITANFSRVLGNLLEDAETSCYVGTSDLKVYIRPRKTYLPDLVAVCDPAQIDENDCLRNPVLIAEVLSPSTDRFDQNEKFRDYRSLPSLRHYVLVRQDVPGVLHYAATDTGWVIVGDYTRLDDTLTMELGGATVAVPLARIYRRIDFGPEITSDDAE